MKKSLKFSFYLFLAVPCVVVFWFFWASSATMDSKEYSKLKTNQYATTVQRDSVFSIVTYNIGYLSGMTNNRPLAKPKELFDTNLQKVLKELKAVNPDIIAFQEIDFNAARSYHVDQQNEISKLGYTYVFEAINWDENYVPFPYWPIKMHFGKIVSGQSILSKYPLKAAQRIVLERVKTTPFYRDAFYLERLAQVVKVVLNGQEVVLISVHLEAFDKETRVQQFDQVLKLFKQYKTKYPTILLGDFNSKARDKAAAIQELFAMPTIGNAAFIPSAIDNTFDTKNPHKRIDYIFYTKNSIEYIAGSVLHQFEQVSDHLPVKMQFKLK